MTLDDFQVEVNAGEGVEPGRIGIGLFFEQEFTAHGSEWWGSK